MNRDRRPRRWSVRALQRNERLDASSSNRREMLVRLVVGQAAGVTACRTDLSFVEFQLEPPVGRLEPVLERLNLAHGPTAALLLGAYGGEM
jgi:hypothetical protein